MASLEYHLEGNLEDTLEGISYVFILYFTVLLKQLQRLYTGGFIFQVPLVYNYSTCCTTAYLRSQYTNHAFTCSVHQPPIYASGALIKH